MAAFLSSSRTARAAIALMLSTGALAGSGTASAASDRSPRSASGPGTRALDEVCPRLEAFAGFVGGGGRVEEVGVVAEGGGGVG